MQPAVPYFGLILVGFAWLCLDEFLSALRVAGLLFVIMSRTPFVELNNPPLLIAATLGTMAAFALAMLVGRFAGGLSLRKTTLAGLSGAHGNIGYMGPGSH